MQKRVVQSMLLVSGALFAIAIALSAFARPLADSLVTMAGRGSAGLALAALALFVAFKVADSRHVH